MKTTLFFLKGGLRRLNGACKTPRTISVANRQLSTRPGVALLYNAARINDNNAGYGVSHFCTSTECRTPLKAGDQRFISSKALF